MTNNNLNNQGLYAPFSYWNSSKEDLQDHLNGCGPHSLPDWIVPDNLLGTDISRSCNIHDWMFKESKENNDFKKTDQIFLQNMMTEIGKKKSIFNIFRKALAFIYYGAVRIYSSFQIKESKD